MSDTSILIADIGGTNARISHLQDPWKPGSRLGSGSALQLGSVDFENFEDFVGAALQRLGVGRGAGMDAVFSVAGPVTAGRVHLTNLAWAPAEENELAATFGFRRCRFVNDLVAAAWGLTGIPPESREGELIQAGTGGAGAREMLLNVGTGLGVAFWSGVGATFRVDASEAGHMGFAPPGVDAFGLFEFMSTLHGRVSWERVLAGSGLAELHRFLTGQVAGASAGVVALAQGGDAGALRSIRRFSQLLGVYAGDLALGAPALGGVSLIGGVVDGLGRLLDIGGFVEGFCAKGRMEPLLRAVPVVKITEPRLGLTGAWRIASERPLDNGEQ